MSKKFKEIEGNYDNLEQITLNKQDLKDLVSQIIDSRELSAKYLKELLKTDIIMIGDITKLE